MFGHASNQFIIILLIIYSSFMMACITGISTCLILILWENLKEFQMQMPHLESTILKK